ncbi:MAG: DUF2892 domain-containing protein [Rhizobiaceae bacterium]|nr:DUF2892 domain-containing protein [Rhizobiaceae bacterium]
MLKKANLGSVDRILRLIAGAVLIVLPFAWQTSLGDQMILFYGLPAAGIILIATALLRFCPLYRLFGISTCKVNSHDH